jgi:archaellum component FlaC
MDWPKDEIFELVNTWNAAAVDGSPIDVTLAVATRAVELARARGGTMTAGQIEDLVTPQRGYHLSDENGVELGKHIAAQGATVATLQAEVKDLRERCAFLARERDEARSGNAAGHERCPDVPCPAHAPYCEGVGRDNISAKEAAALQAKVAELEASADELQRQRDLRGEALEVLEQERDALKAKVEELEKERSRLLRELGATMGERGEARAEVERLKTQVERLATARDSWKRSAQAAESRLASIREPLERAESARRAIHDWDQQEPMDAGLNGEAIHAVQNLGVALADAFRGLEGDAPQEGKDARKECTCLGSCRGADGLGEGWRCVLAKKLNLEPVAVRYPCSPTCTHDDAAKPGHPERVKEQSAKVMAMAGGVPQSPLEDASPETEESSEAIARYAESYAYDRGAEAMRAECLEAVLGVLQNHGYPSEMMLWKEVKAAIEGAVP